jgi:hypothetical protein
MCSINFKAFADSSNNYGADICQYLRIIINFINFRNYCLTPLVEVI